MEGSLIIKTKTEEIIKKVLFSSAEILIRLNRESIDVYNFLQTEFNKGDVTTNYLFQFVYRSFYRLDNAGLTPDFKKRYFDLMQENRSSKPIDPRPILESLYSIPTHKVSNSFQFSFTTKLINTIDPNFPIYDSEVSKAIIGTDYRPTGDFELKLSVYLDRHQTITNTYKYILESNSFAPIFKEFDVRHPDNRLDNNKKLDFIFWSYGKLL